MRLGSALLVLSFAVPLTMANAAQLVADKTSGCKVVDEEAAPDHSVRWTGSCAGGAAEGAGTAEFLAGDTLIRRVEASFSKGVALGPIKVTRYKNGVIATVTEFTRGDGADDSRQKVAFYRDGALSSIESGRWAGGKLTGECSVERYTGGRLAKSYSGTCVNGAPDGSAKVRIYGASPGHDVLFAGPYHGGKLEGQGESSEVLTAASPVPAESCLRAGDVTLHYSGEWKANAMNGQGNIESHFCSQTPDKVVHHIDMTAAGAWIDGVQDGETLAVFVVDGAAPSKIKQVFDHGKLVSETLVDAPAAKEKADDMESVCRRQPWFCSERTYNAAPFVDHLTINRS